MDSSSTLCNRFIQEISGSVVGRENIVKLMVIALLSQGHILLEGNPGLGKTTLAKAFAQTIGGEFKRIQMTPDTLPSDILGTYVYDQKNSTFSLHRGPIFGNVILVDELNRATPKAQSALLEAMQERQVSFEGETTKLKEPFIVIATQVGFGSAGTYPLSEVQSDRFAFSVRMGYPTKAEAISIISKIDEIENNTCKEVLSASGVASSVENAKGVFVSEAVKNYIVSFSEFLIQSEDLKSAPSIRASIALQKGSRALAFLEGRNHVIPDNVKFLVPYVFSHRIFLKPEAIADEVSPQKLISSIVDKVPVPKE